MKFFKGIINGGGTIPTHRLSEESFMSEVYEFCKKAKVETSLVLGYADTDMSAGDIEAYISKLTGVVAKVIDLPEHYGSAIVFSLGGSTKPSFLAELEDISVNSALRLTVGPVCDITDNLFEIFKGIVKDSDCRVITCSDSVIDSETLNRFDGSIPNDFFSCFFAFYNGIKVGDRQLVTYNLQEMKKSIVNMYAPDVLRLTYINLIHCFSKYLGEEYTDSYIENFPETIDEAFDIVSNMSEKCFEKMCISGNNSEYIKREVLRIVETEFSSPFLSVTTLADRLGISTSYLSRYFKEKTGVTLFSYIDEIRIAKAKQLLIETDTPIKEIVHAVGYNDINNFNRKFKLKTGQTPSAYRRG